MIEQSHQKFSDLVDVDSLQELCESFADIFGAATALLDLEGNILLAAGWHRACTQFHRLNPETAALCVESDTALAGNLAAGKTYNVYKCKNGLVDVAVPVRVGGVHLANLFAGQFFFEKPRLEEFVTRAADVGFDREAYISAIRDVPVYSEDKVQSMAKFLCRMAEMIGEYGLAKRELSDALSEANAASLAKSNFLAHMSHELRTPLNSIIGFTEMMTSEVFGALGHEKYSEYANDILASSTHLLDVINDILDISRIESGKLIIEETLFHLNEAIDSSLRLVAPLASRKNIEISVGPGFQNYQLSADLRLIHQVMTNLIHNAVKFTHRGGSIEIECTEDGGGLVVAIVDNGPGIEKEYLDQIKEPFAQARSTTETAHDGTGLGLSICDKLINLHDGDLIISSEYGHGTTAQLVFPAHRVRRRDQIANIGKSQALRVGLSPGVSATVKT